MPQSVSGESFFGRFSSSARSSIASKDHKATVQLLDDSETIQCEYKKNDTGQALLDYVCDYLNVVEKDYFGLRYQDANKHRYWLDTTKQITRQVRASPNLAFRLRIRFYPADPSVIKEEITRYQLFLQLRRDLLHGRLYCPQNEAAALGAYIIQSELGDYDPTEHKEGYVSEYKLFLKQTSKLEEKIAIAHQGLRGLTPADAELQFLKKASQFDTYGFDPHTVKDAKQGSVYIGVTHQGILVYQANRKVHHIKWNDLDKVDYLGKEFRVYPKASYFNDDLAPPVDANEKTLN
uniref:Moesin/ezrin/radixin homolog 1 n=1 Tax=Plectus sambesii TaxID=2011161 RepID=A0A914ULX0_9BILA